jgi:trehalose-6-phosphate synthase
MVAQVIADNAAEIDSIWIHDFHLFLVPKYLRNLRSELKTGFFLHIPFPSSEVFRQLPSRKEILEGMLEADLIGFHDYAYLRHFCEAADTLLHKNSNMLFINYQGRKVSLGVFPISIDTEKFIVASVSTEVMEIYEKYRKEKKDSFLILGVDRLDYIKGVLIRLKAFR